MFAWVGRSQIFVDLAYWSIWANKTIPQNGLRQFRKRSWRSRPSSPSPRQQLMAYCKETEQYWEVGRIQNDGKIIARVWSSDGLLPTLLRVCASMSFKPAVWMDAPRDAPSMAIGQLAKLLIRSYPVESPAPRRLVLIVCTWVFVGHCYSGFHFFYAKLCLIL